MSFHVSIQVLFRREPSVADRTFMTGRRILNRKKTRKNYYHFISEYNHRKHCSLKMSPVEAMKPENEEYVYAFQFRDSTGGTKPAFYIGQREI